MGPHANIKYAGSTPGADANVYVLFASTNPASLTSTINDPMNANLPENFTALTGTKKLCLLLDHVQAGTLRLYESINRGTNWRQIDEAVVAAPAAASSTAVEFLIESLRDFMLVWVNGGVAQNPWDVNLSFSDDRAAAI